MFPVSFQSLLEGFDRLGVNHLTGKVVTCFDWAVVEWIFLYSSVYSSVDDSIFLLIMQLLFSFSQFMYLRHGGIVRNKCSCGHGLTCTRVERKNWNKKLTNWSKQKLRNKTRFKFKCKEIDYEPEEKIERRGKKWKRKITIIEMNKELNLWLNTVDI